MSNETDIRAKVYDILKGFSTAMFVTVDSQGRAGGRPMHVAQVEEETGEIWFLTGERGTLAEQIQKETAVLLTFQNDNSAYLSLRGHARIQHDASKIAEIWKEPYKVWFPKGPADPDIALVAVALADAEYWDNRGMNKLEYLFKAAKAYVKGEKPDMTDKDQHAKATL